MRIIIPASAVALIERTRDALEVKAERGGVPPSAAQSAAKRGLELRREFGRGGTMIGVARARDLSNGTNLSESTVRRMKAYFDRHEVDKQGKDWDNQERPSNGKIAWLLWGGDAGRAWATSLVKKWNREDGKKSLPHWLPNGAEITTLKQLAAVLSIDEKTAAHVVLTAHDPSPVLLSEAKGEPSDEENDEDGDWTSRTGTRHYSQGRVFLPVEEKRQVRDSAYWRAPVGTPLPLPSRYRRSSTRSRIKQGIGTHGVVRAAKAREDFRKRKGLEGQIVNYHKVTADRDRAARIADAYDKLSTDDPKAHKAYDRLVVEINEQFAYLTEELGVKIEFVDYDPYKNSQEMMDDVENNNRLRVLSTSATGPHPYLTNEQNDRFRAVHDYFGHAATGRGFAQDGEEAAWISHSLMFGADAQSALTTETRGQNSWYNTRKNGYAKQKVALLPSEFWKIPKTWEMKDVFGGTRGMSQQPSGGVTAPFEILKPVPRQHREQLGRIIGRRERTIRKRVRRRAKTT